MTIEDILRNPAKSLRGTQHEVFHLPPEGPVLVKGCAGSGKTLIAVARAEYLSRMRYDTFREKSVAIFTYNKELSYRVGRAISTRSIRVQNIDSWAFGYLADNGYAVGSKADWDEVGICLRTAIREKSVGFPSRIFSLGQQFFNEEIAWIKGGFLKEAYGKENFVRTGRGSDVRLSYNDRLVVLSVMDRYDALLREKNLMDYEDRILVALEHVRRHNYKPFTHVVIDEAQDLTMSRLNLVTSMVDELTNSITIVADMAQQIYHSGFSWAKAGLMIKKGRSFVFTKNYRNTRQIAEAAASLMTHEEDKTEFTDMEVAGIEGEKPKIIVGSDNWLTTKLSENIANVPANESVVIAVYKREEQRKIADALGREFSVRICDGRNMRGGKLVGNKIDVCTFHSLKGLEYDHVILLDVSKGVFPPDNVTGAKATHYRKLLNVTMTRARKTLKIFCEGEMATLLEEIDPAKVDVEREAHLTC